MEGHGQPLKAHPRVDVLVGQRHKGPIGHAVEFHEHEVPNLDDLGMVFIHKTSPIDFGAFLRVAEVNMDFRTGTARPGFAHFPEVVFFVSGQNPVVGHVLLPLGARLDVFWQPIAGIPSEDGDVEAFGVQAITVGQEFPCPVDGLGFEIVAKRPIPQHLKQGVVVGVDPHFFQVVVLAADAQALLGVRDAWVGDGLVAEEQILEGIHPSIDEHQGGIVLHDHGCGGHNGVLFLFEKIQKCLANET